MTSLRFAAAVLFVTATAAVVRADAPVASFLFPAGGQRGTTVAVRVGALNLHKTCAWELLGPGVQASKTLTAMKTLWFEGPLLPLPDSQQAEDYPRDFAAQVAIAADAPLGTRPWRLWNAQGATPAMKFMVGDLPEVVEEEIDGAAVPVGVRLPVTINGRIFPREDVDLWAFDLKAGETVCCEVHAARLGSPLDARLEVLGPDGRRVAENDDHFGADPFVRFTAKAAGKYQVKIHDTNFRGGPAHVYRLTVTAGPHVDRVYPLGGRRGGMVTFGLHGQALPQHITVFLPKTGPTHFVRFVHQGRQTNTFAIDLDDMPEYITERDAGKLVSVPAVCNGRIGKPGAMDDWRFAVKKGDVLDIELRAARLGSPLLGELAVLDAAGKELARSANAANAANVEDPVLRFTAAADGAITVRVQDRFRTRGGEAFAYRLRVAPLPAPDFRLQLASDAVSVPRGGQVKLKILAQRLGKFDQPIQLEFEGLPAGVTATSTVIAAKQLAVDVTLKAEAGAIIRAGHVVVKGSAKVGNVVVRHTATLPLPGGVPANLDRVLLAVTLPTPFRIKGEYDMRTAARGTVHSRKYTVERIGYDGPIEVRLADRQARHLQGVTGPTVVVPAGATEFEYAVQLPPWMETGRTCRVCVLGITTVKTQDGSEHVVSFSSVAQNEQIVAVVEPGPLGVAVGRTSLRAEPGATVALPVRVLRGDKLKGSVKVELLVADHIRGVTAAPLVIAANQERGVLTVRFAKELRGPFNRAAVVRATLMRDGRPVIAEASVELLSAKGK